MDNPIPLPLFDLDDFLNITNDAVIAINLEQRILLFNRSAEQIFGYQADEILGQQLSLLIPVEKTAVHREQIKSFASSPVIARLKNERQEIAGLHKDGRVFPVEASIAKITSNGETILVVFLRDISQRKQIEQDLVKWAQAFEHAEWGVAVGEAEATTLGTMNPAFARMYGYTIEELTGKPIRMVYAPEERAKVAGRIQEAHEKGHISYEAMHLRKDGSVFPALVDITAVKDPKGKVLYRVVNVLDISERKQAELALRESEARYASIITAMDEGISLMDADGVTITINASAEHILGLTSSQMMGRTPQNTLLHFIHEDGSPFPAETRPSMVTLRTGQPCKNIVMGALRPDGSLTWISVNTQPLFHPGEKQPYAVLSTFADITERMQMVQLLERRVQDSTRNLSALLEVSRNVSTTLELKPLLTLISAAA